VAEARRQSILLRDRRRSPWLGVLVALASIAAITAIIAPLKGSAPVLSLGVLYLLAVLLVSTFWGLWLGIATAIGSAAAFNWFHIPPTGRFTIADAENWVGLAVFLAAAVVASTLADVARSRATEADRRRREADLAADMARLLLGEADLDEALSVVSQRLAVALGLPGARVELGSGDPAEGETTIPLDAGHGREAVLLLPSGAAPDEAERVKQRVVPALQALLAAALDREALQAEVVETRALRRSDDIKTALLRAVSHDLRSPLTAIVASADAVSSPALEQDERDELAASIKDQAERLSLLVDKLLDLSRLQAGEAQPRRDWVSIEEVARVAADELEERDPGAHVKLSIDPELPLVRADPAQLERAFANLLENARRYSGDHPVQIRAREVAGRVLIRVVDRGPGIPKAELDRIFEPFHRADRADGHRGSGLGLAIVRGFVEANGGRVWAESLPGQGTVFVIELPVEHDRVESPA
jgi:two-component system, OmpR family, sensor histidine kinase KdpD